jgi:hypothetical protein
MVEQISKAKQAIQMLYFDRCNIYGIQKYKDPVTKEIIEKDDDVIYSDIPCKLSYKDVSQAYNDGISSTVNQVITLKLDNELVVKPGSKIVVTRSGSTTTYKNSGAPAIGVNQQIITLELFKEEA